MIWLVTAALLANASPAVGSPLAWMDPATASSMHARDSWFDQARDARTSVMRAANAVARCESDGDPDAKNPTSSASGLYQFVDGTWEWVTGLDAPARSHPVEVQTEAFVKLWDGGRGASHWEPTRHCWERILGL